MFRQEQKKSFCLSDCGKYFFLIKKKKCPGIVFKVLQIISLFMLSSAVLSALAPSYLIHIHKHKDMAAACLEEFINPRRGSSCERKGDPGQFATVCYL